MNTSDLVNGAFEFVGAGALAMNVRRLWQDRCVQGMHWSGTVFFTVWGLYNLYFYPSNGLWFSFMGGVAIVLVNLTWISMMLYFNRMHRDESPQAMLARRVGSS